MLKAVYFKTGTFTHVLVWSPTTWECCVSLCENSGKRLPFRISWKASTNKLRDYAKVTWKFCNFARANLQLVLLDKLRAILQ
jgi:hypothetical protein